MGVRLVLPVALPHVLLLPVLLLLALSLAALPARAELPFAEVFRAHAAVMLLVDPDTGVIRDANPAAARFYGYPLERLRGMRVQEINLLIPEQVQTELQRAKTRQRQHFIFRHRLASGEVRKVAVWSTPQQIAGETLLVSFVADVTEMREAEDPFWHYQSGLEEKLDLQSSQITDYIAELRAKDQRTIVVLFASVLALLALSVGLVNGAQRRKRAEATAKRLLAKNAYANETLQRFTEVAAHHLQEPCRRMVSYSRLIGKGIDQGRDPSAVKSLAATLERQAVRQRTLVRDIQLYLAAGQASYQTGVPDPAALIRRLAHELIERRSVQPVVVAVDALPPLPLDAEWLTHSLRLLLENAVQHSDPERPLKVRVWGHGQQGRPQIRVADDGPGIPEAYRERVFGVFEQLRPSDDPGRSGIGLAIVRRIMETIGGRAWAEETPGGGVTIVLEFPTGETSL